MNRNSRHRRTARKGLTLFEILLALAIFLASLAALSQLIASGTRAAVQGRLQTEAIFRCESKLAELVAGEEPIEARSNGPFEEDRKWRWSLTVEEGPWPDLNLVEVTVSHEGQNAFGNTSYTLRRYLRDPRLFEREDADRAVQIVPLPISLPANAEQPDPQEDSDG